MKSGGLTHQNTSYVQNMYVLAAFGATNDHTIKMSTEESADVCPTQGKRIRTWALSVLLHMLLYCKSTSQCDRQPAGLLGRLIKHFFLSNQSGLWRPMFLIPWMGANYWKRFSKAWITLTHFPFKLCVKHTNKKPWKIIQRKQIE